MVVRENSFILVVTLFFLALFSFLALGILEQSLWESKMESYYEDKIRSFYQAEQCLMKGEDALLRGELQSTDCMQLNLLRENDEGGPALYALLATGSYGRSVTVLYSVLAKKTMKNSGVTSPAEFTLVRQAFLWYSKID